MSHDDNSWIGTGATPRAAVRDLLPAPDAPGVAWVEGVESFSDRTAPGETAAARRGDVTVIYDSRPPKQYRVTVTPAGTEWRAEVVGGKKIDV